MALMSKAWKNGSGKGWRRIRERILQRDGHMCQMCGQTEGRLHIDHIIPKRLIGAEGDNDSNLRVLCESCNLRKGGRFFGIRMHRIEQGLNTYRIARLCIPQQ